METRYIEVENQIRLAYYEEYNPSSKIGIVLIHGLAEHKGRYEYFYKEAFKANISIFALDIRGHGESGGIRGYIDDFRTFLSDLDLFVDLVKIKYPHLKIALLGHSLGGLIATGYVEIYNKVDFLILSNPLLEARNLTRLFHVIPYKLFGKIRIKKRHSESIEMLKYSYNDPLASNYFTLRLLGCVFKQGIVFVSKQFESIKIPVLLLGGASDPLIKSSHFQSLLSRFSSLEKKLIIYENTKHRLLQSERKDEVISHIVRWLNKQILR